ncbi:MAG: hypothetical protein UR28_C0002G0029 [Candidatus Peregrinibacteria bacterium GW2011_GWF2_33_10]|nr:MAG: hypothetical protein UR28_C0002G0029 [Candidatus Peregrinibacteria bacterium GW2011_GWF2_33_10]OGJ45610.1 MAG: hypothetical protein A2263_00715 [Candidatus Peregrinibacteria bacterium RIFOXYA2_FULL_33_21]OGJ46773.1 MAG: hypothetical protein A2272_02530 [Candidatus Peregrinibacteria bacterium RIFOXYA12_FULL_33_12]OGJ51201.1 MAG: hypothetical protein A2307_01095 [Candidatus Peregrinibacteria bacterium RIFOXYB2_FULL_33_20]
MKSIIFFAGELILKKINLHSISLFIKILSYIFIILNTIIMTAIKEPTLEAIAAAGTDVESLAGRELLEVPSEVMKNLGLTRYFVGGSLKAVEILTGFQTAFRKSVYYRKQAEKGGRSNLGLGAVIELAEDTLAKFREDCPDILIPGVLDREDSFALGSVFLRYLVQAEIFSYTGFAKSRDVEPVSMRFLSDPMVVAVENFPENDLTLPSSSLTGQIIANYNRDCKSPKSNPIGERIRLPYRILTELIKEEGRAVLLKNFNQLAEGLEIRQFPLYLYMQVASYEDWGIVNTSFDDALGQGWSANFASQILNGRRGPNKDMQGLHSFISPERLQCKYEFPVSVSRLVIVSDSDK